MEFACSFCVCVGFSWWAPASTHSLKTWTSGKLEVLNWCEYVFLQYTVELSRVFLQLLLYERCDRFQHIQWHWLLGNGWMSIIHAAQSAYGLNCTEKTHNKKWILNQTKCISSTSRICLFLEHWVHPFIFPYPALTQLVGKLCLWMYSRMSLTAFRFRFTNKWWEKGMSKLEKKKNPCFFVFQRRQTFDQWKQEMLQNLLFNSETCNLFTVFTLEI